MNRNRSDLRACAQAIAWVVVTTVVAYLAAPRGRAADHAMIQLLAIVLLATRSSVRVTLVGCAASFVAMDYLFIEPRLAFAWLDGASGLIFAAMLVVGVVISSLNQRLRRAAFRAETQYALNVELSRCDEARQLATVTASQLERLFSGRAIVLLADGEPRLEISKALPSAELARQAWERREFCRNERAVFVPLLGVHAPYGVVGLELRRGFDPGSEQGHLLVACAAQLATAIERLQLTRTVRHTQLEAETERLRSSLLSAVSHDLKTPLTSIIAAGCSLNARGDTLSASVRHGLVTSIISEGERLNRLLENLLSFSRLESSTVALRRTPEALDEIAESAVERFLAHSEAKRVEVELPRTLPLVSCEPLLIEQVLTNLLENAARYAGPAATIFVRSLSKPGFAGVEVADDGPGIAEGERSKIFEKFYRGSRASKADGGVGLGLTICRAIIEAHGGHIRASERPGGGAALALFLPSVEAELIMIEAS